MQPHGFQVGMKLEAVDPRDCHSLGPATVMEVTDKFYFIAKMDSLQEPVLSFRDVGENEMEMLGFACHRHTPTIFPVGWAASKGIKLRPPHGESLFRLHIFSIYVPVFLLFFFTLFREKFSNMESKNYMNQWSQI